MALHCQGGGTPLPSLKKSLAHEKYFWRGLEKKKSAAIMIITAAETILLC
jgi:hypothetical protein